MESLSGRIHPRHSLSCHLASIVVFPGRAGVMSPDDVALVVAKLRLRGLEHPGRAAIRNWLAGIYLKTRRVCLKDHFLGGRNLDQLGDIGTRKVLPAAQPESCHKEDEMPQSVTHPEEFTAGMEFRSARFIPPAEANARYRADKKLHVDDKIVTSWPTGSLRLTCWIWDLGGELCHSTFSRF